MDKNAYKEKIIEDLKASIRYDVNSGIDRPCSEYLDRALENLKGRYQAAHKRSRYHTWTIGSGREVVEIWMKIQPEILSAIEKYLQEFRHKKLTKEIKATTAKAAIKAAMQEAGLKHQFTGQTYRAKVSVLITRNRALTIYISYKKMHEQLPRVIESLKLICQEIDCLGKDVLINKAYNLGEYI